MNRANRALQRTRQERRMRRYIGQRLWTDREIKLLGRFTDKELARRLGRTFASVSMKRRLLKVSPAKFRSKFRVWKDWELKLLGTAPDRMIAKRLKRSVRSVLLKRLQSGVAASPICKPWTAAEKALLGKLPDREVARITGHGEYRVSYQRRRLGIVGGAKRRPVTGEQ